MLSTDQIADHYGLPLDDQTLTRIDRVIAIGAKMRDRAFARWYSSNRDRAADQAHTAAFHASKDFEHRAIRRMVERQV